MASALVQASPALMTAGLDLLSLRLLLTLVSSILHSAAGTELAKMCKSLHQCYLNDQGLHITALQPKLP